MDLFDLLAAASASQQQPRRRRLTADSIQSMLTGMGIAGTDKTRDTRPGHPVWLTLEEMETLPTVDAIIRAAVHAVPEDALGQGWRVDSGTRRDVTADLDDQLLLVERLIELDSNARQYGGALALVVTDAQDLAEPLGEGPHEVHAVHVFTGREITPIGWEPDLRSPGWALPSMWSIHPLRQGLGIYKSGLSRVHASHVVYMPGLPRPRSQIMPFLGLDLSVPQAYWERARDLGLVMNSAAILAMEHGMAVLNIQDGRTALAGSGADESGAGSELMDALSLWDKGRSVLKTSIVTGNNTVSRLAAPLDGYANVVRLQYEQLGAVERVPISVMMQLTPSGLASDDIPARRNYELFIARHRRTRPQPALRRIYDIALGPDSERVVVWPAVYPPTPSEQATISVQLAQRDQILVGIGAVTPDESRGRISAEAGEAEAILPVLLADAPEPADDLDQEEEPDAGLIP